MVSLKEIFAKLGIDIVAPLEIDIGYCEPYVPAGEMPCISNDNIFHTHLLRSVKPDKVHCIPQTYIPVKIVYHNSDDTDIIHDKQIPNMKVVSCKCG